ncbi:MAG: polymer-forming cytoskeletal protein [Pseudomonadota bacterium]
MIGPSIKIKGEVSGKEDLLIQGSVEGTINLADNEVSVGADGEVVADIHGKTVRIDGNVTGDINGSEKVVVSSSGNVRGNIVAPRVTLEDGAVFKGSIDMNPSEPSVSKPTLGNKQPANSPAAELDLKSG